MNDRLPSAPHVRVLQHVAPETPGLIGEILESRGARLEYVRPYAGDPVRTDPRGLAGLLVMGGPMGVYETARYPHIAQEIELIRNAVERNVPVLGVCLGSQLLAAALGASVGPGAKEIGWHEVEVMPEAAADTLFRGIGPSFTPFHWHGDRFDLPSGAIALARSERTACQAFRYGRTAYGLLFHAEMTVPMVRAMVDAFGEELEAAGEDADAILAHAAAGVSGVQGPAIAIFGGWADLLVSPRKVAS